jgi:hypothetical protein
MEIYEQYLEEERQIDEAEYERLIAYLEDFANQPDATASTIEEEVVAEEEYVVEDEILSNDVYDEYKQAEAYEDYWAYDYYDGYDGYDN